MIESETIAADRPSQPLKGPGEFSALDFLILLARRKRFVLLFTFGAAVLAAILICLAPNQYTASTTVLPPSQGSFSSALLGQLGSSALASYAGGSLGLKNPAEMYVALFQSRTVQDALIQRFSLMARYRKKTMFDTRLALEKRSTIVLGVKDGLIRISVQDRDPSMAAALANGYVEEYRKLSANLAIGEASQRRLFFQQQLLDAKQKLAAAEDTMKKTEQSTGVLQIDTQAKSLIETAAGLRAQIVAKQVQMQGMRSYATEDNPEFVLARQQLVALQAELARLGGAGDASGSGLMLPKGKVPEAGMEYIRAMRDVKYYETIADLIAKQYEVAQLDEARQGSVIQVADIAVPLDRKSSPHRALVVALTFVAAFVLSLYWIFLQSRMAAPEISQRLQLLKAELRTRSPEVEK